MPPETKKQKLSPWWMGIGLGAILISILLVTTTALDRWGVLLVTLETDTLARLSSHALRDFRLAIVHCLLVAYLPAAILYVLHSGRRRVLELQPALGCTTPDCERIASSLRLRAKDYVVVGAIGVALSAAGPYLVEPAPPMPWNPSTWSPEVAWHRLLGPPAGILGVWLASAIIVVSTRMSQLASQLTDVDLLDQSALAPFTQQALANALSFVGVVAIYSLTLLETGFGTMMSIVVVATTGTVAFALWLLLRGVHVRIVEKKRAELQWINDSISSGREAFRDRETGSSRAKMADLVAYRELVQSIPEWPITASTYTRIVLYVLIPMVSWSFGFVAEEILSRVLF